MYGASANALVSINIVPLHWAQLVLGCVTVYGQLNHLSIQSAALVNSTWPSFQDRQNEYQQKLGGKQTPCDD